MLPLFQGAMLLSTFNLYHKTLVILRENFAQVRVSQVLIACHVHILFSPFSLEWVLMGRHRRSEIQILTDILTLSLKGVKTTHLMYKANLSYSTLRRYLSTALKQNLIRKICNDDGSVEYCITEKGKLLLERLKEVKHVLQS